MTVRKIPNAARTEKRDPSEWAGLFADTENAPGSRRGKPASGTPRARSIPKAPASEPREPGETSGLPIGDNPPGSRRGRRPSGATPSGARVPMGVGDVPVIAPPMTEVVQPPGARRSNRVNPNRGG